ncbi:MAG: hypothetical protein U1F43_38065 [Myxococcota bacterium]
MPGRWTGVLAVTSVALMVAAVGSGLPPSDQVPPAEKPWPVTVSVVLPPSGPEPGVTLEMTGGGFCETS